MARPKNSKTFTRLAGLNADLRKDFADLHDVLMRWRTGDCHYIDVQIALDAVWMIPYDYPEPPASNTDDRDSRLLRLTNKYMGLSDAASRLAELTALTAAARDKARDEMAAVACQPLPVPEYMDQLAIRMLAEGVTQSDVHPASRELARHMVAALREFNERRSKAEFEDDDVYDDAPLRSWKDLPRRFAGWELTEQPRTGNRLSPNPLPPSTDIAYFTETGERPQFRESLVETYDYFGHIIEEWQRRNNKTADPCVASVWALLLAHRIPDDGIGDKYYESSRYDIVSPWNENMIAFIDRAT